MPSLVYRLFMSRRRGLPQVAPAEIEHEIADGDELPFAGGLCAVLTPGHSAGHLAFLWPQQGGLLIAADACANMFGLGLAPVYEDVAVGRQSLARLAKLKYERAAFGHGGPILSGADQKMREKWSRN